MAMWLFLNDSYLSVVQHRDLPGALLVRSRVKGDIERAVPGAKVFEDLEADYRYRAVVDREAFKTALCQAVDRIDYDNFKGSIHNDPKRHEAATAVWQVLAQRYGAYGSKGGVPMMRRRRPVDLKAMGLPEDDDIRAFLEE